LDPKRAPKIHIVPYLPFLIIKYLEDGSKKWPPKHMSGWIYPSQKQKNTFITLCLVLVAEEDTNFTPTKPTISSSTNYLMVI